jgi:hypothetical protein
MEIERVMTDTLLPFEDYLTCAKPAKRLKHGHDEKLTTTGNPRIKRKEPSTLLHFMS